MQDRYAEALLRVLLDNGPRVLKEPNNYAVRANIMWTSTQALNHWLCQGVKEDWATHMIAHELTAFLGMDHARTLACIQPRVLKFQFEAKKAKYDYAQPFTKESLLYREIFEKYYPGQAQMIAGFWMPNKEWEGCDVNDPSARVLSNYGDSGK